MRLGFIMDLNLNTAWFGRKPKKPTNCFNFRAKYCFNDRQIESDKIMRKFPNKIPVIIELSNLCMTKIKDIDDKKYLLDKDVEIFEFMTIIRKKINLDHDNVIILMTDNGYIPNTTETINDVYLEHHNGDGFLYLTFSAQKMYGEDTYNKVRKFVNTKIFNYPENSV